MRGKPIDQVTQQDLDQLIADQVTEDRRLEFKSDVPVSPEEIKAQRSSNPTATPVERSWTRGKSLANFGRDAIAAEVVAFANADGGTLIIGIDETDEAPPRAKEVNALPDIAGLERRLRDVLIDCIEPRLPYLAVRGLPLRNDGSGVILVETGPSVLGPHWVRTSRRPMIRRADRCDPMSMPEVHEMVLRHARTIDLFMRKSDAERSAFVQAFARYLRLKTPNNYMGSDENTVRIWLTETGQAALGAQITITPHFDLGLPRLESMDGLIPSSDAVCIFTGSQTRRTDYVGVYSYVSGCCTRILGGTKADQSGGFEKSVKIMRDGLVVASFMQIRATRSCTCSADLIVGASGFALGVFDRLRKRSSYPVAPADLMLDICVRGNVGVGDYEGIERHGSYGSLAEHTTFPNYSFGDSEDISILLQEIGSDLMNAGGMPASHLPRALWHDPH